MAATGEDTARTNPGASRHKVASGASVAVCTEMAEELLPHLSDAAGS